MKKFVGMIVMLMVIVVAVVANADAAWDLRKDMKEYVEKTGPEFLECDLDKDGIFKGFGVVDLEEAQKQFGIMEFKDLPDFREQYRSWLKEQFGEETYLTLLIDGVHKGKNVYNMTITSLNDLMPEKDGEQNIIMMLVMFYDGKK